MLRFPLVLPLMLVAATLPFAAAHPIHTDCQPWNPTTFALWHREYLDQLLVNNPEDPIGGDIFSGIIWYNECWQHYALRDAENICDLLDLRTSGQMFQDWLDGYGANRPVAIAVPPLHDSLGCWD